MLDVLVVGGGPGGSAAAWQAASKGLSVLVCDRAEFPRDKPCGDGLTPRAVKLITEMGLGAELERYHRVDRVRLVGNSTSLERPWPTRVGIPGHGYVVPRTELDHLLLERAAKAGADVWQGAEGRAPITENGVVRGAVIRRDGKDVEIRSRITIAADGMSSRIGRALGVRPSPSAPFAIAVRAQIESERADDPVLEVHFTLKDGKKLLPGYGWVFPMGNGVINIGAGYLSTYSGWKKLNINSVMGQFIDTLPPSWGVPSVDRLLADKQLDGWRLPMALSAWPPARPGFMAVGDAAGAIKPFTGVGISKAIQTGMLAGVSAADALASSDPTDMSKYVEELRRQWGAYYRMGRGFTRIMGQPRLMGALVNSMRIGVVTDFLTTVMTGNGDFAEDTRQNRAMRKAMTVIGRLPSRPGNSPEDVESPLAGRIRTRA